MIFAITKWAKSSNFGKESIQPFTCHVFGTILAVSVWKRLLCTGKQIIVKHATKKVKTPIKCCMTFRTRPATCNNYKCTSDTLEQSSTTCLDTSCEMKKAADHHVHHSKRWTYRLLWRNQQTPISDFFPLIQNCLKTKSVIDMRFSVMFCWILVLLSRANLTFLTCTDIWRLGFENTFLVKERNSSWIMSLTHLVFADLQNTPSKMQHFENIL